MKKYCILFGLIALLLGLIPIWALEAGNSLPAFQLPRVEGGVYSVSADLGQKKLVVWLTDFDAQAMLLLPRLVDLSSRLPNTRFILISVNGEDTSKALAAKQQFQLPFPVLLDPHGRICQQLCGFYIQGVEPNNNLIVTASNGLVLLTDYLPGYPLKDLEDKLK